MLCTITQTSPVFSTTPPLCTTEPYKNVYQKIQRLDMTKVMTKVKRWRPDLDHEAAEKQYRLFIYLCSVCDGFMIVPNDMVDEVWHNHILFTHDYLEFCNQIAGKFIHHNPLIADCSISELLDERCTLVDLSNLHFGSYPFGPEGNDSWCGSCRVG
jgi:hypothetical protein